MITPLSPGNPLWGVRPILFSLGNFHIQSYPFFVSLGLVVGILFYIHEAKKQHSLNENSFYIAFGAIVGGILGAKILEWIINYDVLIANFTNIDVIFSGRTVMGGLIGGIIGAKIAKKITGIKGKRGNLFAPGVALGIAIGRIGCLLRGCCFGVPTNLPWGFDFGDHIARHPTQIYESIFMLMLFFVLLQMKKNKNLQPGQLYKTLMISYFTFRFFIEFIRVENVIFAGMTAFQLTAIGAIVYLLRDYYLPLFVKERLYVQENKD